MPNNNPIKKPNEPTKPNKVGRHQARCNALQAIYQWHLSGNSMRDIEKDYLAHHVKPSVDIEYYTALIHGIVEHRQALDSAFSPYLQRNFQEIDPIELSVLRIATYELQYRLDIPYRVVINEALELTKKFGSIEGYKFINSILDLLAKKIRIHE